MRRNSGFMLAHYLSGTTRLQAGTERYLRGEFNDEMQFLIEEGIVAGWNTDENSLRAEVSGICGYASFSIQERDRNADLRPSRSPAFVDCCSPRGYRFLHSEFHGGREHLLSASIPPMPVHLEGRIEIARITVDPPTVSQVPRLRIIA
jgi:hypothetical protein